MVRQNSRHKYMSILNKMPCCLAYESFLSPSCDFIYLLYQHHFKYQLQSIQILIVLVYIDQPYINQQSHLQPQLQQTKYSLNYPIHLPYPQGQQVAVGGVCAPTNQFILQPNYYILNLTQLMTKLLLLLLLLAVYAYSQNCINCRPPVQIQNCNQPKCYRCGLNQVFNPDTRYCDCAAGFYPINGVCGTCRKGYQYDDLLQQCIGINPCGINQYLLNGKCVCLPGLTVIQNICQRCPQNQTYAPAFDACRCSQNYTLVNGSCILIKCGDNQIYSADQQACVCAFGYYLINGTCGQCANRQIYSAVNQTCTPFVPPLCGFNQYWFGCCCFCQRGFVKINGICNTCPQHSSYDAITDSCVCDKGYYFVGEEVKQIPYQQSDTGSSFTSNPTYLYSYKDPFSGSLANSPIIVLGSNYDASRVNTNGPNIGNIYNPPVIGSRR